MPLCKARQQSSNASRMKQTGPSVRMPVCTIIYAVISAYFIQQYHLFAVSLAFRRSSNALRVVDSDSFRSLEIVGMDGQQMPSLLARSARYLYTEIALWGKSIRYSSVKLRIFSSCSGGASLPHLFYYVLSAVFSGIEAAFRFGLAGSVSSEYNNGYSERIAFSRSAFPA